ncbi:hypothetical protein VTN49DRAFT_2291 [Thermomyces lanuginosus]|uniref:uncharacterized protein n=1 Tax=Thermomyces lanuginosus TaxID=5541 RepID=UPI0037430C7F
MLDGDVAARQLAHTAQSAQGQPLKTWPSLFNIDLSFVSVNILDIWTNPYPWLLTSLHSINSPVASFCSDSLRPHSARLGSIFGSRGVPHADALCAMMSSFEASAHTRQILSL